MNKKIALLIAAIVAATSFQISFADEYDRRADAADEILVSASSDAGKKQSDELMQSPDPDTTAQPEATTGGGAYSGGVSRFERRACDNSRGVSGRKRGAGSHRQT